MALAVSATNSGSAQNHPNYSVNVSAPSPAPGSADDWIIVVVQYRVPTMTTGNTGASDPPDTSFLNSTGLATSDGTEAHDQVSSGTDVTGTHRYGCRFYSGFRSDFTGGGVTVSKGPSSGDPDGEIAVHVTTVTVGGPTPLTSATLTGSGAGAIGAGYGVFIGTDWLEPDFTFDPAFTTGGYTERVARNTTGGLLEAGFTTPPYLGTFRLLVGDVVGPAAAVAWNTVSAAAVSTLFYYEDDLPIIAPAAGGGWVRGHAWG